MFKFHKTKETDTGFGLYWFVFRYGLTRLQIQEGVIKTPIDYINVKFHFWKTLFIWEIHIGK